MVVAAVGGTVAAASAVVAAEELAFAPYLASVLRRTQRGQQYAALGFASRGANAQHLGSWKALLSSTPS